MTMPGCCRHVAASSRPAFTSTSLTAPGGSLMNSFRVVSFGREACWPDDMLLPAAYDQKLQATTVPKG